MRFPNPLARFRRDGGRPIQDEDGVEDEEGEEIEEQVVGREDEPRAQPPSARQRPSSASPAKKGNNFTWIVLVIVILLLCVCGMFTYAALPEEASTKIAASDATETAIVAIVTQAAQPKPTTGKVVAVIATTKPGTPVPTVVGKTTPVLPTPTVSATPVPSAIASGETPEILQVFILFLKLAVVWGTIGYIAFQASRLSAPKLEVVSDEDASISYSLDPQGRVDTNLKLRLRKKLWGWALKRFWISEESAHRQLHEATAARVRAFAESLDADHWQDMAVFVEQCNEFIEQLLSGTSIKNLEPLENASEEIKEAALEAVTELCNIGSSVAWEVVEIMLGDLIADADLVQWNRREELDRQRLEEERHADERQKLALEQERGIAERAFQTQINTVNAQLAPFRTLLTAGGLRFDDSEKLLAFFQGWLNWSLEQRRLDLAHAELEFKKSQAGRAPESSVAQQTMASALSNLVEWLGRASPEDLANALRGRGFAETVLPSATSSQGGNRNNGGG